LLDASDQHHAWAATCFKTIPAPLLTCEAAIAEAFHLLRKFRPAQEKLLDWIADGILRFPIMLENEIDPTVALWRRYADVPMSLADACLVRLAEVHSGSPVCTTDSDFSVYRVQRNRAIPLIHPTLS
jgi:predicted nucleic acid-binding protein